MILGFFSLVLSSDFAETGEEKKRKYFDSIRCTILCKATECLEEEDENMCDSVIAIAVLINRITRVATNV